MNDNGSNVVEHPCAGVAGAISYPHEEERRHSRYAGAALLVSGSSSRPRLPSLSGIGSQLPLVSRADGSTATTSGRLPDVRAFRRIK